MTAARTIPENPKPGERYAEWTGNTTEWYVFVCEHGTVEDGSPNRTLIATHLSEADARLLVFGAKAVEALRDAGQQAVPIGPCVCSDAGAMCVAHVRAAKYQSILVDLEGKS